MAAATDARQTSSEREIAKRMHPGGGQERKDRYAAGLRTGSMQYILPDTLFPAPFAPKEPPVSDHASRLTEIEIQLTHQQRLTEQLSEVLSEQAKLIERLGRRIHTLENQFKQLPESGGHERDLLDEKPPHY